MQDLLENILNDIYALDPSLREQEADVRALVLAFLAEKPTIQIDKQFASSLRESLVVSKLIEKKAAQNTLPRWMMYLTPVGVAAVIILMLIPNRPVSVSPTALPVPAVMEDNVESEMVPELYDAPSAKRSAETVNEDASMMMQMSADSVPMDSLGIGTQMPGKTFLVDFASLNQSGFLAIQEYINGEMGEIVGVSPLLVAGLTEQIEISLTITTQADQTFYAVLYYDDGDGLFDKELDTMVLDSAGLPLQQLFSTTPILLQ
jgi:hypothetical protein